MTLATAPALAVTLAGRRLNPGYMEHLAEVRVVQAMSLPTLAEFLFVDLPDEATREIGPTLGSPLELFLEDRFSAVFTGEITAVEHEFSADAGRIVRVRAYDSLHRLRKRRPVRVHSEVTAVDLAREMTADLGLALDAPYTGPGWNRVYQCRQSDYEVLRDVSGRAGLHFIVRDETLSFFTLEGNGRRTELRFGGNLIEARIEVNTDSGCRAVSASGWSPRGAVPRSAEADEARSARDVRQNAPASAAGGEDERTLVDLPVEDDAQAEAAAQAALDHLAATEVVLRGTAEGDPQLSPGVRVQVEGLGDQLSGAYVLTRVEHLMNEHHGYVCRISSAPPEPGPRNLGTIATLGEVTAVDDPEQLGRVKVSLSAFGSLESDWLDVVTPGAGAGKGFVVVPDVGDRVLLLCPRGDPGHGIVVGSVYGSGGAPDETVADGRVRRYSLLTPGGHRVRLDDETELLSFVDTTGSSLELGPDAVVLRAKVPLVIEAPGQPVKVRGASIDFEQA